MALQPTDINAIMEKDPLSLTTDDLDAIITLYRERRTQYKAGVKPEKPKAEKKALSLNDLGDLKL